MQRSRSQTTSIRAQTTLSLSTPIRRTMSEITKIRRRREWRIHSSLSSEPTHSSRTILLRISETSLRLRDHKSELHLHWGSQPMEEAQCCWGQRNHRSQISIEWHLIKRRNHRRLRSTVDWSSLFFRTISPQCWTLSSVRWSSCPISTLITWPPKI